MSEPETFYVTQFQQPEPTWQWAPTGHFKDVVFNVTEAPNAFHRFMQRVCFGFKCRPIHQGE